MCFGKYNQSVGGERVAEATDRQGMIYQNLKDAGCDEALILKCMSFVKKGNAQDMLPLLKNYKYELLGKVRKEQEQIDCLDFLVYKLQKETI